MFPKYIAVKKQATHWYDSVDDLYADERERRLNLLLPEEKKPTQPTQVTMDNSRQTIIPEFDPSLDRRTGWDVDPVTAIRYMGDHRAGSPVPQRTYQTSFEGVPVKGDGIDSLLPMSNRQPEIDFNAPTVEAPHGKPAPPGWKSRPPTDKDADHGYPDEGGWLYRDPENGAHYWYKSTPTGFQKYFMDVQPGAKGSWWSKATAHDFSRAEGSASNPSKIVALRGDPNKYGIASQRDSDEALEHLAEMFLQHNENIPPEALVEIPLRENIVGERNENYMDAAHRVGIPMGHDPVHERPSRWSDEPLPFGPSRTRRKLEDVPDTELYRAEPMDIAFQLLKGKFDLMPMVAANELLALRDDPTTVRWHNEKYELGLDERGLSKDEIDELLNHIMESDTSFDPLVPGGMSHAENVERYEQETGLSAKPMGVNMSVKGTPFIDPTKPETWKNTHSTTWSGGKPTISPQVTQQPFPHDFDYIHQGEPMEIAFQLLKDRKSPEAWANKKRYDSQYQKNPKRVKYREQLNTERRRRGIYGKGGKDVSHTQGGKLTLESPHTNRARHFKNRGTLRRVKIK